MCNNDFRIYWSICMHINIYNLTHSWHRLLFTKLLIPELTCELCNPFDDWLESTSPTNHREDYVIRVLTQELKFWWLRPIVSFKLSLLKKLHIRSWNALQQIRDIFLIYPISFNWSVSKLFSPFSVVYNFFNMTKISVNFTSISAV